MYVALSSTHFDRGSFPFVYLGVPVGPGKRQVAHFLHNIDRIAKRTNGWQVRLLYAAGHLVLIKLLYPLSLFMSFRLHLCRRNAYTRLR